MSLFGTYRMCVCVYFSFQNIYELLNVSFQHILYVCVRMSLFGNTLGLFARLLLTVAFALICLFFIFFSRLCINSFTALFRMCMRALYRMCFRALFRM